MKIKPLFDRVVIEEEKEDTTKSGIFVGKVNQETPKVGKVLFVGEGNENSDGKKSTMYVKVDDKVLFSKYAGDETMLANKPVYIIRQTDILAIIE